MYLGILCAAIAAITCVVLQALLMIGYAFPIVCVRRGLAQPRVGSTQR
jgi:hypothetical protein